MGVQVERRREELGLSKRAAASRAGITEGVWRQIESGKRQLAPGHYTEASPSPKSIKGVCLALGWTGDSIARILNGEPPEELQPDSAVEVDELLDRVERLAQQVTRLSRLTDAMGDAIDSLSVRVRSVERRS